jgi:hypothetical protein
MFIVFTLLIFLYYFPCVLFYFNELLICSACATTIQAGWRIQTSDRRDGRASAHATHRIPPSGARFDQASRLGSTGGGHMDPRVLLPPTDMPSALLVPRRSIASSRTGRRVHSARIRTNEIIDGPTRVVATIYSTRPDSNSPRRLAAAVPASLPSALLLCLARRAGHLRPSPPLDGRPRAPGPCSALPLGESTLVINGDSNGCTCSSIS